MIDLASNYVKRVNKPEPINLKLISKIFIIRTEGFTIGAFVPFFVSFHRFRAILPAIVLCISCLCFVGSVLSGSSCLPVAVLSGS